MNLHQSALFPLALAVLAVGACASGSAIITGNPRSPIAQEQVKLYLEPPDEFEVIGLVNASSDAGWTEQESLDYAIDELKKQAAKLGANGLLLVSTGDRTTAIIHAVPVNAKTVQAKAIFVKDR